jgi:hypothetical protein
MHPPKLCLHPPWLQYNFPGIILDLDKVMEAALSKDWTLDSTKPGYVLKWVAGRGRQAAQDSVVSRGHGHVSAASGIWLVRLYPAVCSSVFVGAQPGGAKNSLRGHVVKSGFCPGPPWVQQQA